MRTLLLLSTLAVAGCVGAAPGGPAVWDGGPHDPPGAPAPGGGPGVAPGSGPDDDQDGVPNGKDRCSLTPAGKKVWASGAWAGCAAGQLTDADDGDRDGVPNGRDRCPKTPRHVKVYTSGSRSGCPLGSKTPPPPSKQDKGVSPPPPPPKQDKGVPPPPPPPSFKLSAKELDLLNALNKARQQNGLAAVKADAKLTCAARMHAVDFAGGCDHTGSDGSWPWDRAKKCGFPQTSWTVNEICAGPGFTSGTEAVWGWKQSSGHWKALVHTQAKLVGLGVGSNGCYVALFDCCVAKM